MSQEEITLRENTLREYILHPSEGTKNAFYNSITPPQKIEFPKLFDIGLSLYKSGRINESLLSLRNASSRIGLDRNFILNVLNPKQYALIGPLKRTRSRKTRSKRNRKTRKARK